MTNDRIERRKDPDERTLEALQEYIDTHITRIEDRLAKWLKGGIIAFAIIGLCCAAGLIGLSIALGKIQDAREEFVLVSCLNQNERHDKTILRLNEATEAAIKSDPKREQEILASKEYSIRLIDALAPKQDCYTLSKAAVGEADTPKPEK